MRCWKLADKSRIRLRRRYRKEVRACIMAQRRVSRRSLGDEHTLSIYLIMFEL